MRLIESKTSNNHQTEVHPISKEMPKVISDTIAKIAALGSLNDGWDTYRAKALSSDTLNAAICLVYGLFDESTPRPSIVPVPNGSVQIEWSRDNKVVEVEIKSFNEYELYFSDLETEEEYEKTLGYEFDDLRSIIIELGKATHRPNLQVVNG